MPNDHDITIVEVGARDGLQNEHVSLAVEDKLKFIDYLAQTGLDYIEAGSFVAPKWVPQMAASDEIFRQLAKREQSITYSALVPNFQGLERAIACEVKEIAVFISASETFSQKNINKSIAQALALSGEIIQQAQAQGIKVRGYLSCVLGCPYEGKVSLDVVHQLTSDLLDQGAYQVSLGDTIGVGTPFSTRNMLQHLSSDLKPNQLAGHFHDTYGQALANVFVSLEQGLRCFDSSVAGLGGCPYAKGASGNLATEDLVYMLQGSGFHTGVDLEKLFDAGDFINQKLGRSTQSKVAKALHRHSST